MNPEVLSMDPVFLEAYDYRFRVAAEAADKNPRASPFVREDLDKARQTLRWVMVDAAMDPVMVNPNAATFYCALSDVPVSELGYALAVCEKILDTNQQVYSDEIRGLKEVFKQIRDALNKK